MPPRSRRYTELPAVSWTDWNNLARVKSALTALETGSFELAADLVDAMGRDDRIEGVLGARLDALAGLEFEFEPPAGEEENEAAVAIAEEASREWTRWIPEDAVRELRAWGLWLNAGIAQVRWERGADRWTPRLEVWHARNVRWNATEERYEVLTREGLVPVVTGTGEWVLYTPYGARRGWMRGLLRSLAVPWLIRQWGLRDWAGHSEAHGTPAKKAKVPPGTPPEQGNKFLREVALLSKRMAIKLEQGRKGPQVGEVPGFDVELLEATVDGHRVFKELLAYCDVAIAVRVKGSNLTTEVSENGSRAASQTHREVDNDKLRFDAQTTSTCLHDQVVEPWAEFNHGARELAPWPSWATEPPEDLRTKAETLDKLGDALKKLGDAAVPIDGPKIAEDFGIPLRELTDEERELLGAPPIYQYHIEGGVPTVNEVRRRLRLPPREDGNAPTGRPEPEPAPAAPGRPRGELARLSALPSGAQEGQDYADELVAAGRDAAAKDLADELASVLRIIRKTPGQDGKPDAATLRRKLLEHYRGMNAERLAETVRRCMVLARLDGRLSAAEDL